MKKSTRAIFLETICDVLVDKVISDPDFIDDLGAEALKRGYFLKLILEKAEVVCNGDTTVQ